MGEVWEGIKIRILHWLEIKPKNELSSREIIEYLQLEIEKERREKQKLLELIAELNKKPVEEPVNFMSNPQPITGKVTPWPQKRKELEENSRKELERKKEAARSQEISQLEKELGVN
jgi:hypothetical protein